MSKTRQPHAFRLSFIAATVAGVLLAASGGSFAAVTPTLSLKPAAGTPQLATTGTTEQVRQLVQCGSTMYAVGSFTRISSGSTTYTRNGAFSFSATSPFQMTAWDPEVNGTVNTIAFNGSDCSNAYLGGKFTSVGGTAVKNLAEVSTSTGAVVPTFAHSSSGQVDTMVGWNGHLFTGGIFTSINGSSSSPYFASLNPSTGRNDGYLNLNISGNYVYTDQSGNPSAAVPTRIYNQQISHGGSKDLVEGVFTTIGGQPRRQVAVIDLGSSSATTDGWHSSELDQNCAAVEPFYAKAAAWSPDDQQIYIATTGYKPASGPGFATSDKRAGLCDVAAAFPALPATVSSSWINYTGCDSLYAAVADTNNVYVGGHERWASNPNGCDTAGSGAIAAPGMVGLSALNGAVAYNPTRGRGKGADDMILTSAGLWVASDNQNGANQCGGVSGHAGICFLPYS